MRRVSTTNAQDEAAVPPALDVRHSCNRDTNVLLLNGHGLNLDQELRINEPIDLHHGRGGLNL